MRRFFTLLIVGCLALVGCGGPDDDKTTETTPKATPAAAANVDLAPIKDYLLETKRDEVATVVKELQGAHIQANPAYEEMEGVVAGVPSLADYDVIIDAGSDGSDPESAVPFSLKTKAGKEYKQPGNFFALVETSVFGTEPKFTVTGVKADLDGD